MQLVEMGAGKGESLKHIIEVGISIKQTKDMILNALFSVIKATEIFEFVYILCFV